MKYIIDDEYHSRDNEILISLIDLTLKLLMEFTLNLTH